MKRYMDVNRYMDMKRFIVQTVSFAILIGYPPVSAAQVEAGDDYTNAQCTECHEERADDHALSLTVEGANKEIVNGSKQIA